MTYQEYMAEKARVEAAEKAAAEKERAESQAEIEKLKARSVELLAEVIELKAKRQSAQTIIRAEAEGDCEWLCYLPSAAGTADFMRKACQHLEETRIGVEKWGGRIWLDKDHDSITPTFQIDRFVAAGGAIFIKGRFLNPRYRERFLGVSPDEIVYAGAEELSREQKFPPGTRTSDDLPLHTRAARRTSAVFGLAGACCMDCEPCWGRRGIIRLTP